MKLAIFDFDGTIYRKETFKLLMKHLKTTYPKRYRSFFAAILPVYVSYKLKLIEEKNMKARLMHRYMKTLKDFSSTEIDAYFDHAALQMNGYFNDKVIERLLSHQQAGDYVMILSGAFTPLLRAVDQELKLGCNALLGTKITRANQSFIHVHAEQKPAILHDHLKSNSVNWSASYAYGDSMADLSVLDMVGYPVAVSPDQALTQIAEKRNWEIIQ